MLSPVLAEADPTRCDVNNHLKVPFNDDLSTSPSHAFTLPYGKGKPDQDSHERQELTSANQGAWYYQSEELCVDEFEDNSGRSHTPGTVQDPVALYSHHYFHSPDSKSCVVRKGQDVAQPRVLGSLGGLDTFGSLPMDVEGGVDSVNVLATVGSKDLGQGVDNA